LPPPLLKPPIAITPEQVILQYRNAQGWIKVGDRHCPLLYLMKNFHNDGKKILIIEHHLVPQSPYFFTTHFGYAFFAIVNSVNPS
jgi:hypothetical protein